MRKPDPDLLFAFVCGLFERVSQASCLVLVPLVALRLGAPVVAIGIVTAAANLAPLFMSIPLGAAADRLGCRRVAVLGALVGFVFTLASGFTGSYWLLALWQFGGGVGRTATWIGAQALVTSGTGGQRRANRVGWLSLSAQIGNLIGPVLGGLLLDHWGATTAFTVAACTLLVVMLTALLERAPARAPAQAPAPAPAPAAAPAGGRRGGERGGSVDFRRAAALFRKPGVRFMASTTLVRLSLLALKGSYYVVLLKDWGLSAAAIGTLLSLTSVAAAMVAPLHGASRRYISTRHLLLYGLGTLALSFAVSPFAPGFWPQVAVMVVAGVATGLTQPALIAVLAESVAVEEQGLAVGLRTALNRLAQFTIPVILGFLVAAMPLALLFPILGAACGVTLGLAPRISRPVSGQAGAD